MSLYDTYLKEIDNSKEKIAWAIAKGICNGNETEASQYYKGFRDVLLNGATSFFIDIKSFHSTYMREVVALLKELSDFVDYDVSRYVLDNDNRPTAVSINVYSRLKQGSLEKMYYDNFAMYDKIGLSLGTFRMLFEEGGNRKIEELNKLIKKVNRKVSMIKFKDFCSTFKDMIQFSSINKRFDKIKEKFNLENIDDLLDLNTEIDSFFVDESTLSDQQKRILENNKKSFRARIGAKEDYFISEKDALKLKKEIEKIYNFNLYRQAFDNTNLREFFENNDYEYNAHNLKRVFNMLFCIFNATAICSNDDLGKGYMKHCMFGKIILDKSADYQNNIIIHEFIHAVEKLEPNHKNFCDKYSTINEAMTEFFTKRSSKYFDGAILPSCKDNPWCEYGSMYDNMLPLVETLEKSELWDDFVNAKFFGKTKELEEKIGVSTMNKINKCFMGAFCLPISDIYSQRVYARDLEKVLRKIVVKKI